LAYRKRERRDQQREMNSRETISTRLTTPTAPTVMRMGWLTQSRASRSTRPGIVAEKSSTGVNKMNRFQKSVRGKRNYVVDQAEFAQELNALEILYRATKKKNRKQGTVSF
jgi:hypothetical protein